MRKRNAERGCRDARAGPFKKPWAMPLLIGSIAVIAILAITRSSHCWAKRRNVAVTRNGKTASGSSVYYSPADIWLIKVEGDEDWYSFYPNEHGMGVCGNLRNHVALPGYLLLRDEPRDIPCVWFSPVKAEDPELLVKAEFFEFTSLKKERVRVSWLAP